MIIGYQAGCCSPFGHKALVFPYHSNKKIVPKAEALHQIKPTVSKTEFAGIKSTVPLNPPGSNEYTRNRTSQIKRTVPSCRQTKKRGYSPLLL